MRRSGFLLATMFVLSFNVAQAQFEEFLRGGTDDANTLLNHYMTPFMKGIGYGFNSGWYNTAKPHQTLGFDLTVSFNAAFVPAAGQTFEFDPTEYSYTRLSSGTTTLPTFMGGNTTAVLENYIDNQEIDPQLPPGETILGTYDVPNGVGDDIVSNVPLIKEPAVPSPILQVGVGIIKGTELKIRWAPTIQRDDFSFNYFGIGAMHSISQWLPVFKELPIDISGFIGYTNISAELLIPPGNISGAGQKALFDVNTFSYQLVASAKIAVLTGYIGLGMDNFNTRFQMLGTYQIYPQLPILTDPIDLQQSGNNSFRTTFGARLKLAIITIHADYTLREYNTLNAGIGFNFR